MSNSFSILCFEFLFCILLMIEIRNSSNSVQDFAFTARFAKIGGSESNENAAVISLSKKQKDKDGRYVCQELTRKKNVHLANIWKS